MINYNKIEEKEFVFVNKPHSDKEDKAFSDFLKRRKTKVKSKKKTLLPTKPSPLNVGQRRTNKITSPHK